MNFKQWFEGGGGFIYGAMTDPVDDRPPSGSEITTDPYLRVNDFPPTRYKQKKHKTKLKKIAKYGFDANDGSDKVDIRKEILPNYFI